MSEVLCMHVDDMVQTRTARAVIGAVLYWNARVRSANDIVGNVTTASV